MASPIAFLREDAMSGTAGPCLGGANPGEVDANGEVGPEDPPVFPPYGTQNRYQKP